LSLLRRTHLLLKSAQEERQQSTGNSDQEKLGTFLVHDVFIQKEKEVCFVLGHQKAAGSSLTSIAVGSWKSSLCQTIKSVNDAYDYKNEKTAWQ
jgi:hypothetical protein